MTIGIGYPDAATTGVPLDTTVPTVATLRTTRAGQVIEGVRITAPPVIGHADVEMRNCLLPAGLLANGQHPTLDNCTIGNPAWMTAPRNFSTGLARDYGVGYGGFDARRCRVFGVGDGFSIGTDTLLEDCCVHDLYGFVKTGGGTNHCDGVQMWKGVGVVIRRCNIDPMGYKADGGSTSTSAVNVTAEFGNISDVVIEDCLLGGSYSYTLYVLHGSAGRASAVTVRRNRFRRDIYPKGSQYGIVQSHAGLDLTWGAGADSNVWADTGAPIPWDAPGYFNHPVFV